MLRVRTGLLICVAALLSGPACSDRGPVAGNAERVVLAGNTAPNKGSPEHLRRITAAIDDAALVAARADADWITHGQTYAEERHSALAQIHRNNVEQLGLAWTLELGSRRGIQATPLVVDGIMFFTGPWSVVYAVDVRKGSIIWQFDPKVDRSKAPAFCCGVNNRGVALYKGAVFVGTLDGRLISLDASDGSVRWSVLTIPQNSNYSITGAPRIVKGKVLIGNGGAEYAGVRGYVTAYDARTGRQAWRFYTVPGNPKVPFEDPALERAAKTWSGEWWLQGGGGTVWDSMVYDPELNLVYIGVGNGSHWDRNVRSPSGGDNLFLSSIVALDADSGRYVWHYQTTPGDSWDYTATQPMILTDLEIDGRRRKVLLQAPKNGFFYVIDRVNGELISAAPYSYLNWASGIDGRGRPIEREDARYADGRTHWISPSSHGAHNWFPMSYSPSTGLVYIPGVRQAGPFARDTTQAWNGPNQVGSGHQVIASFAFRRDREQVVDSHADAPRPGTASGELIAYDPVRQRRVWAIAQPSHYNGGLLTTAGGLLMQGDAEGYFSLRDDRTGELLKRFDVRSGVISSPVTYLVDGEQYITLLVEWGGGQGQYHKKVDKLYPGTVYTFKLGGAARLPPREAETQQPLVARESTAPPEAIGRGLNVYLRNCVTCHGEPGSGGGVVPDLLRSPPEIYEVLDLFVLKGALAQLGMPSHSRQLSSADVADLRDYLLFMASSLRSGIPPQRLNQELGAMQRQALDPQN